MLVMIHGKSNDPVLIKRIKLNVWTLRDEVEAAITLKKKGGQDVDVDELIALYKDKGSLPTSDELEEESTDESEAETSDEEAQEGEADNVTPIKSTTVIKQYIPDLPAEKLYQGNVLLSELYMEGMYFFCEREFTQGQSIVIDIQATSRVILNAVVAFSRVYNMKSRIISETKLPYRTGVKFTFLKEGERTLLRNFIKSIEPDFEDEPAESTPAAPSGDGGEDFDIFDDLE